MFAFRSYIFLIAILAMPLGFIQCGGTLDPCVDFDCPDGEICVDVDGDAVCQVPSNGGGTAGEGEACDTTEDCMTGLVCTSGIDGIPTCEPG